MNRIVPEKLGLSKGIQIVLGNKAVKSTLKIGRGFGFDQNPVKRLHQESLRQTVRDREQALVTNPRGVIHHRTHFGNHGFGKTNQGIKTRRTIGEASFKQARSGPTVIFSCIDNCGRQIRPVELQAQAFAKQGGNRGGTAIIQLETGKSGT